MIRRLLVVAERLLHVWPNSHYLEGFWRSLRRDGSVVDANTSPVSRLGPRFTSVR